MWSNEQTAALIAAIEDDMFKMCQFDDHGAPHLNYERALEKCVFDLPRNWITLSIKLKRTGKHKSIDFESV